MSFSVLYSNDQSPTTPLNVKADQIYCTELDSICMKYWAQVSKMIVWFDLSVLQKFDSAGQILFCNSQCGRLKLNDTTRTHFEIK